MPPSRRPPDAPHRRRHAQPGRRRAAAVQPCRRRAARARRRACASRCRATTTGAATAPAPRPAPRAGDVGHTAPLDQRARRHRAGQPRLVGDPFRARVGEGRVVGLGACDTKGAIAAILSALDGAPAPRDLAIAFTGDEERTGTVIRALLERERDALAEVQRASCASRPRAAPARAIVASCGLRRPSAGAAATARAPTNRRRRSSMPRASPSPSPSGACANATSARSASAACA